jgi:aspartate kinase
MTMDRLRDTRRVTELVVCKFGGTSVADIDRVRAVAQRLMAMQRGGRRVVAVLSAMGNSTDELVRMAHRFSPGPHPRELDALLSLGESKSCALAALTVHALGGSAVSLTASQAGVFTDEAHGCAQLDEIRPRRLLQAVDNGHIAIVAGFQGVSPNGDVTTLGRGGSDATAVALAATLGLRSCEIFTDVPGVFTADPKVVPTARRLAALGHEEMLLLAAGGAAVMQPRAVELALNHSIDIHVRSAFSAETGTWIRKENAMLEDPKIVGVAHRSKELVYTVRDVTPTALASALARRGVVVGTLVRDRAVVRFTAPGAEEPEVVAAMRGIGARVAAAQSLGSVSLVGSGIGSRPEIATRALAVLARLGVEPELVTITPGRISCNVSWMAVQDSARALHDAFGLDLEGPSAAAA